MFHMSFVTFQGGTVMDLTHQGTNLNIEVVQGYRLQLSAGLDDPMGFMS